MTYWAVITNTEENMDDEECAFSEGDNVRECVSNMFDKEVFKSYRHVRDVVIYRLKNFNYINNKLLYNFKKLKNLDDASIHILYNGITGLYDEYIIPEKCLCIRCIVNKSNDN